MIAVSAICLLWDSPDVRLSGCLSILAHGLWIPLLFLLSRLSWTAWTVLFSSILYALFFFYYYYYYYYYYDYYYLLCISSRAFSPSFLQQYSSLDSYLKICWHSSLNRLFIPVCVRFGNADPLARPRQPEWEELRHSSYSFTSLFQHICPGFILAAPHIFPSINSLVYRCVSFL